ncbi:MAG: uracil-DNA glycosylase [Gammaproteobacteria bacterium]|nr:uracil-DNA glycosylase [Gammaproteobacteria bacterium]MYD00729.1 uracil-DNA glycosylase [Gammaproteobacteria bacterium]MYI25483.1 uracil-DNA glycosylase [Gammaproteobacteria bacterium]
MTLRLAAVMEEWLAGWRSDLTPAWRDVFAEFELPLGAIDPALLIEASEPIYPSRRRKALQGAPEGAHLFRAFDELAPKDVRCVLLGQDPYPDIGFSTGRAFEAGAYSCWSGLGSMPSHSMRSLIQCVYAARLDDPGYAVDTAQWPRTLAAISDPANGFAGPQQLAQEWVDQGVLLLNASLTISRFSVSGHPHQVDGHIPLWRPFVARVIRHLADSGRPVVFGLFGEAAWAAAAAAGLGVSSNGGSQSPVFATLHPAAGDDFLGRPNPFVECNRQLAALGEPPIYW